MRLAGPFGELAGELPTAGGQVRDDLVHTRELLFGGEGGLLGRGWGGRVGLGGAQRRVVVAGVAAAQLGVGGDRAVAGRLGRGLPGLVTSLGLGQPGR